MDNVEQPTSFGFHLRAREKTINLYQSQPRDKTESNFFLGDNCFSPSTVFHPYDDTRRRVRFHFPENAARPCVRRNTFSLNCSGLHPATFISSASFCLRNIPNGETIFHFLTRSKENWNRRIIKGNSRTTTGYVRG